MRIFWCLCFCIFGIYISFAIICPNDIFEWNKKAKHYNCPNDEVYHCALDQTNEPIELCFERVIIAPGEERCPWIAKQGSKVVIGSPYRECPRNVIGCPTRNHTGYYFDMLYLFPACLTSPDKRKIKFKMKGEMNSSDQQPSCIQQSRNSTQIQSLECKNVDGVIVAASIFAGIVVILIVFVSCMYFRSNRQAKDNPRTYPKEEEIGLLENKNKRLISRRSKEDDDFIIKRREMDLLKTRLKKHQTAFLIGEWGSGKTIILDWYFQQDGVEGENEVFDCTDTFTFLESLKSWQKRIPGAVKQATETPDCSLPAKKTRNERIASMVTKILKLITKGPNFKSFILVLDDVGTECEDVVKDLVEEIKRLRNVKCVVTSHNNSLTDEEDQPIRVGAFDQFQAISYLKSGCVSFPDESDQKCSEIATLLEKSPIALHCAKTYITNSCISGASALQLFTNRLDQNYIQNIDIPQKIPLIFVMEILRCAHPLVYDMLQSIQFIRPKDIPIVLLQFLKLPTFKKRAVMPADNFVLVVKKFSFISVTGLDLDRVINIHPGVLDVFNKSADNATKKECIMTLLACLSYLFSKRPGPPVTRERYIHLLPHAIETLRSACDLHKEQCNFFGRSDFVVLTIVFDRIIYTLNSMGLNSDAKAFASNFLKMTPFFHNPCEKDPNKCAEAACDSFQESFNDDEKEKLQEIATEYILNKVRRKRNLAFVTRQDKADEYEYQISLADYRKLVDEGNAIDLKHSGTWLFFQVHISIALTIGMKRAEGSPNTEVTGNSLKYIKYATSLAAMLKQRAEFQQMNLYSVLDAEINGMVDLLLHKTTTNETDIDDALQTIKENMQSIKDNGYFVACVKTTCDADMCIYISAMKQIIRLLLWKYKYGQTNNQSYIDEAGKTADELMTYIAERKEVLRELFIAQTAKQWIVECFIRQERFDDALGALDELSSFDPLGDGDHILTKYDVIDIGLRCECYGRRQQDELRKTLDKVLEVKGLLLFDESEMMPLLRDLHEKFVRML